MNWLDARDRRNALLLSALLLGLYAPAVQAWARGGWAFGEDAPGLFAPWRAFAASELRAGRWPLWNPWLFGGLPFALNGQAALGYAPNLIFWLLPFKSALLLDAIAHSLLLGLGGYFLGRALGLSRTASWLLGLCLGANGAVSAHVYAGHLTWHAARAWLPWMLWALARGLSTRRVRYAYALALFFFFQFAAGYPPLALAGAALCAGGFAAHLACSWMLASNEDSKPRSVRQRVGRWLRATAWSWRWAAIAGGLGLGLVASLALPLREVSGLSVHGSGLPWSQASELSGSWKSFARWVVPGAFDMARPLQWSLSYGAQEEASSIGILPTLLALGAPLWSRGLASRRRSLLLMGLWLAMLGCSVLSLGANTPLYRLLFEHVGLFRVLRFPVRWLELWATLASLTAALTFDIWYRASKTAPPPHEDEAQDCKYLQPREDEASPPQPNLTEQDSTQPISTQPISTEPSLTKPGSKQPGLARARRASAELSLSRALGARALGARVLGARVLGARALGARVLGARVLGASGVGIALGACVLGAAWWLWSRSLSGFWRPLLISVDPSRPPSARLRLAAMLRLVAVSECLWAALLCAATAWLLLSTRRVLEPGHGLEPGRARLVMGRWRLCLALVALELGALFVRSERTWVQPVPYQDRPAIPAALAARYKTGERWATRVEWRSIDSGMGARIEIFNGYDAMNTRAFWSLAQAVEGSPLWVDMYQPSRLSPSLRIAGVTHFLCQDGLQLPLPPGSRLEGSVREWRLLRIFGSHDVWPRLFLSRRVQSVRSAGLVPALQRLARTPTPSREQDWPLLLEGPVASASTSALPQASGRVLSWKSRPDVLQCAVQARASCWLGISQAWSPSWRAWVNGRPVPLLRANGPFCALRLPRGKSQVRLAYAPQTWRWSGFVSLCALALLSAGAAAFLAARKEAAST